ncbi:hypothetical protein LEP1GSC038_4456 [Leptospira weilii str. 2006001855]|uniref:Uncharacterized protein n=1 Tax=Leptospira weilii str. 2006001855 TaxID=996804 RepID=M6G6G1_9LEPT|nr:hypothetical protein LEP1GSC038_4456 [Leptospira weilii str. 2006001855]
MTRSKLPLLQEGNTRKIKKQIQSFLQNVLKFIERFKKSESSTPSLILPKMSSCMVLSL